MARPSRHLGRCSVDLPDLIAAAVASRSLTVLWQREARYLNEGDRAEVRRRINAIVAGMRDNVRPGGARSEPTALGAARVGGVQHADQPGKAQPDPSG